MKKIGLTVASLLFMGAGSLSAQDIYKVEQLSRNDLNGDARFVGMGGAMSALGANLSAISSNPASSGLYRRNDASISGSLLMAPGRSEDATYFGTSKTKTSLDQLGVLYAMKVGGSSLKFVNVGFNYKKSNNFKNLIGLNNIRLANGASQSWQLHDLAYADNRWLNLDSEVSNNDRRMTTPLTVAAYDAFLLDPITDSSGKITGYNHGYAEAYHYGRAQWGSTQQYDFNIAFNFSEQYYLGVNIGVYNVEGESRLSYEEASLASDGKPFYETGGGRRKTYMMQQEETLSGTGIDAKFGFIVRPFVESPFRLGIALTTPTYYSLNSTSNLNLRTPYEHTKNGQHYDYSLAEAKNYAEYRIRTPWKVNFSLATTLGKTIAFGAEYEITDHTSAQVRYLDDAYDSYSWSYGTKDKELQSEIERHMRDVHTLRLGLEARISPTFYARAGYNYVSSPFRKQALLNLFSASPSYLNAMTTDYVNLGAINRLTAGLGYRAERFYVDLAYQYQGQKADVYPFAYLTKGSAITSNELPGERIDLTRHQVSLTLGYRF